MARRRAVGRPLTSHYRMLEKSGRKDHRESEGLSARTVRYIHTIIHGVLGQGRHRRAAAAQPRRRGDAAHGEGSQGPGDDVLVGRPAGRVPRLG
jgi:hypothetical protein